MNIRLNRGFGTAFLLAIVGGWWNTPISQASPSIRYTALPGSEFVDDCPICGRPTISAPIKGTFGLRFLNQDALFTHYAVENVSFEASSGAGRQYQITGSGSYSVGGEVALVQQMFLQLQIYDGVTNREAFFTNSSGPVASWPSIQVDLAQTNGTPVLTYSLTLNAAPFREIWFSTTSGFHAGIWQMPTNYVSPGDLISSAGRVMKRNRELTRKLGIMPSVPDVGLDAVDILPGGQIAFSIEQDIFSETIGQLHHGDVLNSTGQVLRSYANLIGPFNPEPPITDYGCDALQIFDSGEIYFSVESDFFSEKLGRTVRRGDLLSSLGRIVKTNEELVARFNPADPKQDYGLDAIYVWPDGEIWFSTETGFVNANSQFYGPGDLLSDRGYVVYGNLDLLSVFQPLEDLSNFGLDALFVITDLAVSAGPAPRLTGTRLDLPANSFQLGWGGQGRVFQLERAPGLNAPFLPVTPIMTETTFQDAGILSHQPQALYRLLQW